MQLRLLWAVALPRYSCPPFPTPIYDFVRARSLNGSARRWREVWVDRQAAAGRFVARGLDGLCVLKTLSELMT